MKKKIKSRNKKNNEYKNFQVIVVIFLATFFSCMTFTKAVFAKEKEVLFEGYFKILSGKQHIGYSISKYEFETTTKRFYASIFTKVGALGGNSMESITAISDENLVPISYEYNILEGENVKTTAKKVEASFTTKKIKSKNNNGKATKISRTMVLKITEKGKTIKEITELPEGTFLSYFLVYLMLKSKSGLQTESKYLYKAIAEEKGKVLDGVARVTKFEDYKGFKAFKIENDFDQLKFTSYVTDKGEVIGVINPAISIETELVAKPNDAIGSFSLPATVLKAVFGEVPLGINNIASKALQSEALRAVTQPPGSKEYGAPADTGILTKPQSTEKNSESTDEGDNEIFKEEKIEKKMPKLEKSKESH